MLMLTSTWMSNRFKSFLASLFLLSRSIWILQKDDSVRYLLLALDGKDQLTRVSTSRGPLSSVCQAYPLLSLVQ